MNGMINTVSFPRLGLSFVINRIAIKLAIPSGGIYWYGIILASGLLLAAWYVMRLAKKEGEKPEIYIDFLLWALPFSILGARLYYVAFSWESYASRPADIFKVWEGGIAIYGSIIGAVLTGIVFFRARRLNTLQFFDMSALGLLIGQSVGRWGNFVNAEAFGAETGLLWGMSINGAKPVHPTFLYESLWNAAGFILLSKLHGKKPFHGFTFFSYVMWYAAGRFFIEGLRTDSLYMFSGALRASQAVAVLSFAGGIIGLAVCSKRKRML